MENNHLNAWSSQGLSPQSFQWHQKNIENAPHEPLYRGSSYIRSFIQPKTLKVNVDLAVRALSTQLDKFDAIAFTGMSGALIGPPVAMVLDKSVIMVRKPDSSTHSSYEVEGDYAARKYIILDDLRATGATEDRIVKAIARDIPDAVYAGFLGVSEITEYDLLTLKPGEHYELSPKLERNFY